MDIYSETLIKRKLTDKDQKKVKLLFAAIIISSMIFILGIPALAFKIGIPFLPTISLVLFGVFLYIIWRVLKSMQIEYEYIITNDNLDFDKIIAQKKRTRVISVDLKEIEEIGVYDAKRFVNSNAKKIDVSRIENSVENFYILYSHPTEKRVLIVFKPDAAMLSALKKALPPRLSRAVPDSL